MSETLGKTFLLSDDKTVQPETHDVSSDFVPSDSVMLASPAVSRVGPVACFTVAVVLLVVAVWLSVEAYRAADSAAGADAWVQRLFGFAAVAVAHLLLAWGVTSRVFPASPLDKGFALTSAVVALLAGTGAVALAVAL